MKKTDCARKVGLGGDAWALYYWYLALDTGLFDANLLVSSAPGFGKSMAALSVGVDDPDKVGYFLFTEGTANYEVIGTYIAKEGTLRFKKSPLVIAWCRDGVRLIIDEIEKCSFEALQSLLPICDSRKIARLTLPTGQVVRPGKISIIGLSNNPDLLPPALLDRFPHRIHLERPNPLAIASLSGDLQHFANNQDYQKGPEHFIGLRQLSAFDELRSWLLASPQFQRECGLEGEDLFAAAEQRAADVVVGIGPRSANFCDALRIARAEAGR